MDLKFKGTQGEWKAVKIERGYEIQFGVDGECVAEFVRNEHDAKLIVVAVELLNACIEVCEADNILKLREARLKAHGVVKKALKQ